MPEDPELTQPFPADIDPQSEVDQDRAVAFLQSQGKAAPLASSATLIRVAGVDALIADHCTFADDPTELKFFEAAFRGIARRLAGAN